MCMYIYIHIYIHICTQRPPTPTVEDLQPSIESQMPSTLGTSALDWCYRLLVRTAELLVLGFWVAIKELNITYHNIDM